MNVRFKDDILHDCSLEFKAGDRMVITGSRNGGKRVAFYALLGIFEPDHILGDIYINRTPIYKQRITRASLSQLIFFLECLQHIRFFNILRLDTCVQFLLICQ